MKKIPLYFSLIIIFILFHNWFILGTLASGDWVYRFSTAFDGITLIPSVWDPLFGDKIGGNASFLLALNSYYVNSAYLFLQIFHFPWEIYERVVWYFPCILIAFFSSRGLYRQVFSKNEIYSSLAGLLYTTNSYFLMVVGGGQIAVGLSIALAPFVIYRFIRILEQFTLHEFSKKKVSYMSLWAGFVLALQLMIDLRFTYITLCAVLFFFLFNIFTIKKKRKFLFYYFVIPFIIMIFLHAFWILAFVISGKNALVEMGSSYSSLESLRFFSTAKIENTFGMMHPYWPENIFGKVGFMKVEFLIYPLFAFGSLLYLKNKTKKDTKYYTVLLFASLGIIGIFLAKGSNDPLGIIYNWMYEYFPGFVMFRDPSKWYLLVVIAYSLLIPFTIYNISLFIASKIKSHKYYTNIFLLVVFLLLFIPVRRFFFGQLTGTHRPQVIPIEYRNLYKYISQQQEFFRTFWVPKQSNLAYSSYKHPLIAGGNLFNESDLKKLLQKLTKNEKTIQEAAVKYIIIPYASRGEMFFKDNKYNEKVYTDTIASVSAISWLREVKGFGKIKVYEVSDHKEHIWMIDNKQQKLKLSTKSKPTHYDVEIINSKKGDIVVLSEGYDPSWYMVTPEGKAFSKKYSIYNSFQLPREGTYKVSIMYEPQKYVNGGVWISSISLIVLLFWMIYLRRTL